MLDYILTSITQDGREVKLDPDTKGWADKELLDATKVWSLIPRENNGLPVITVTIPDKGKPVYKSRVYSKLSGSVSFRVYAIGYKLGRRTHWTWVLPNGNIEVGDEPIFADELLRRLGK